MHPEFCVYLTSCLLLLVRCAMHIFYNHSTKICMRPLASYPLMTFKVFCSFIAFIPIPSCLQRLSVDLSSQQALPDCRCICHMDHCFSNVLGMPFRTTISSYGNDSRVAMVLEVLLLPSTTARRPVPRTREMASRALL